MNILITGAAGFIGSHIVKRLMNNSEHFVVGIDNINDYYDIGLKYGRLSECGINTDKISDNTIVHNSIHTNYHFCKTDIADYSQLNKLFEKYKFDYVINMAAQAGVRYSLDNPHAYVYSNIVGFVNILECCRHSKIKHLIYASSSSVYGANNKIPYSECDRVDHPVSFYAATKKSNELMAHSYSHLYQLPTTGLRLFTVYGPWGRPDMAPMIFTRSICEGKPIKLFNNGNMMRDFTYIDDVVESIMRLINKMPDENTEIPFYQIFNVGNSNPISIPDFIKTLETEIKIKADLEMQPFQPGDVQRTYSDSNKLADYVNYKPSTTLSDGIHHFVDWFNTMEKYNHNPNS